MAVNTSLEPINPGQFGEAEARHLLSRAGFGSRPKRVMAVAQMGIGQAVEELVNYTKVPDPHAHAPKVNPNVIKPLSRHDRKVVREARRTHNQKILEKLKKHRQRERRQDRRMFVQLQNWWFERMVHTARPMQEKLTLLWHSHFATSYKKVRDTYLMYEQNELFRTHANGNFATLVHGIIHDPAMIKYLDNEHNRKRHPNENLARELMELFTVGVQNYNETDVRQGAKALTGYSEYDNHFVYRGRQHDKGMKTIFGVRGRFDGDSFVNLILSRRACPWFISWKIYRHFVADVSERPHQRPAWANTVINELADRLAQHRYEMSPVLKTLLSSRHFYDAKIVGQKIKSPTQLMVGTCRMLSTPSRRIHRYVQDVGEMGQALFEPPSVAGWDTGRSWMNTSALFDRQNSAVYALTGHPAGARRFGRDRAHFDPSHLLAEIGERHPEPAADRLIDFLLGHHIPKVRRQPLIRFMRDRGEKQVTGESLVALLMLITAMPEYQLC